ncbi:MAG TPA: response regulator [Candidatus Acidoferrales bacterium]|nr:response regulator [Candidatus Acidoferrales bacterium]
MRPTSPPSLLRTTPLPLVLIADDDARIRELLEIAFRAEQFRVKLAADGDEALRTALADRPDAVVLDVNLPRKNGFEVCDALRHDPEDAQMPIVLLSSAGGTEAHIESLARGADDYLSKPLSPRELVARTRRVIARASEARAQRRRAIALERDLARAHGEVRAANASLARERRLRGVALGTGAGLFATPDPDELAARVLVDVQAELGPEALALLGPPDGDAAGARLSALATRGERPERFAALSLDTSGELAQLVAGLGRPVLRHELERRGAADPERACFIAAGAALLAPLRGARPLDGLLVLAERADGAAWPAEDREVLGVLATLAGAALHNARLFRAAQERELERLAERAHPVARQRAAAAEAVALALAAAERLELPARERWLLRHAVALGAWGWGESGRRALAELVRSDATRRFVSLRALVERGETLDAGEALTAGERHAALLTGVCVRHLVGRSSGRSRLESWDTAVSWAAAALDPALADVLGGVIAAERPRPRGSRAA